MKMVSHPVTHQKVILGEDVLHIRVCANTEVLPNQNEAVQMTFNRGRLSGQRSLAPTVPSQAKLLWLRRGTLRDTGAGSARAGWLCAAGSPPAAAKRGCSLVGSSLTRGHQVPSCQGLVGRTAKESTSRGEEKPSPGCRKAAAEAFQTCVHQVSFGTSPPLGDETFPSSLVAGEPQGSMT